MVLAITWPDMLAMTGIGFGVVFCILLLLVFVLKIFSAVSTSGSKKAAVPAKAAAAPAAKVSAAPAAAGDDYAAVAAALYLYFQEVHDTESYKLTIRHHEHTAWHPENY